MYFTVEKINNQIKEIQASIFRAQYPIDPFKMKTGDCPGAEQPDCDDRGWDDFRVGDRWGGYDVTAWFRASVTIPEELRGKKLALRFQVGPRDGGGSTAETLLYVNGAPLQGLDVWHETVWLPPELWDGAGQVQIALKAWSGVIDVPQQRCFKLAQLVSVDEAAERFYYLATNLAQALQTLPEDDLRRIYLAEALQQAFLTIDFLKPGSEAYYQSVETALKGLERQVAEWQAKEEMKPVVVGIGHAHIDMAWLWRLRHTREKAARTFSTVLHLMRQYPEYRFMHSSPQLYKYIQEDYPEIFEQIRARVAAGEWEINGGMWVEADTNLTGGESLVRQFLLGRRWVREQFGVEMQTLWLPDVFGYSGALPQIARKSGIKHFLTSKISWSQYNRFPYDTFLWRGIDGTELLTHFVTTPDEGSASFTYNGTLSPAEVRGTWSNYQQKDVNDELLLLYGWGDGGGGPTQAMIESARAMKNLPGVPRVELGRAQDYFERLADRVAEKDLPVWDGELYLEYHRGTYTSQSAIKRANRQAEELYHNAEWVSAAADVLRDEQFYPAEELRQGWERILLNQFHDILPGSSIRQVYEDSRADYRDITETGENVLNLGLKRLSAQIAAEGDGLLVLNPTSWERSGLVEIPWTEENDGQSLLDPRGNALGTQLSAVDGERKLLLEVSQVPSLGYRAFPLAAKAEPAGLTSTKAPAHANFPVLKAGELSPESWLESGSGVWEGREVFTPAERLALFADPISQWLPATASNEMVVTPEQVENAFYRIQLNENGQLTSIWDKRSQREVLAAGKAGNVFTAFEDKPMNFDAWDIDLYYQQKTREIADLVEASVLEKGPLRGRLRLCWRFSESTITQDLIVYSNSPRIDFRTRVDWHEHQVLLKTAFPVAIRSTRATYDIQFGTVERPTHWNTSWDWARFEVPAHKWADLSEGDYGVALLNDCKYGYDVKDNQMRLTLIKSGINPDPTADQGEHLFTYSLLPHRGDWRSGGVVAEAYALNNPLLAVELPAGNSGDLPNDFTLAQVDCEHVIVETVKKAEDGRGWIARVYEARQCRNAQVSLKFGRPLLRAVECNLVEEDERPVEYDEREIRFAIDPYEIKTFRIELA